MSDDGEDFSGRFIVGNEFYGGTGGSENHTHPDLDTTTSLSAGTAVARVNSPDIQVAAINHDHDITANYTNEVHLPPFIDVVFAYASDMVGPTITLNYPNDTRVTNNRSVNFTFTSISSDGFSNCSLWTNETSWESLVRRLSKQSKLG